MCHFFSALETSQWGLILHREDERCFDHKLQSQDLFRAAKRAKLVRLYRRVFRLSGVLVPEGKATPPEGQGVIAGWLSSLVIGLVAPKLVAGLAVAQVVLCILVEIAILEEKMRLLGDVGHRRWWGGFTNTHRVTSAGP